MKTSPLMLYFCFVIFYALGLAFCFWLAITHMTSMYRELSMVGYDHGDNFWRSTAFWGGNPAEVYSHWLNMIAFSAVIPYFVLGFALECSLKSQRRCWFPSYTLLFGLPLAVVAWVLCMAAEVLGGEGTTMLVVPLFYAPLIVLLLVPLAVIFRRIANGPVRLLLAVFCSLGMVWLQLVFEPSQTGGPNQHFAPIAGGLILGGWVVVLLLFLTTAIELRRRGYERCLSGAVSVLAYLGSVRRLPAREEMAIVPGVDGHDVGSLIRLLHRGTNACSGSMR